MIIQKQLDKELLHFILVNNVNKSNISNIYFGKIKSNTIFNTKYKKKTNINNFYDVIPLINSLLLDSIQDFAIYNIKKHYYENKIHIIQKKEGNPFEKRYTITNKLNNFYLYENEIDKCIIFNTIENVNNLYFPSIKEYNHKENYILIEWVISDDIKVQVKKYVNYISFSIKINLVETNKCPNNKIETIYKLCSQLELIIKYFNNDFINS